MHPDPREPAAADETPAQLLARNIRAVLTERGRSIPELAAALGWYKSTLYRRLEAADTADGDDVWTFAELVKASAFLGVPLSRLTDGVEAAYREKIRATAEVAP
jgi:hypothetical protein